MDFDHVIDKNNCLVNISGFLSYWQKNKLKVQVAKLKMVYKLINLHNSQIIKKCLY